MSKKMGLRAALSPLSCNSRALRGAQKTGKLRSAKSAGKVRRRMTRRKQPPVVAPIPRSPEVAELVGRMEHLLQDTEAWIKNVRLGDILTVASKDSSVNKSDASAATPSSANHHENPSFDVTLYSAPSTPAATNSATAAPPRPTSERSPPVISPLASHTAVVAQPPTAAELYARGLQGLTFSELLELHRAAGEVIERRLDEQRLDNGQSNTNHAAESKAKPSVASGEEAGGDKTVVVNEGPDDEGPADEGPADEGPDDEGPDDKGPEPPQSSDRKTVAGTIPKPICSDQKHSINDQNMNDEGLRQQIQFMIDLGKRLLARGDVPKAIPLLEDAQGLAGQLKGEEGEINTLYDEADSLLVNAANDLVESLPGDAESDGYACI